VSSWDRLTDWARDDGLVVVMLISGTLLAVRFARWLGHGISTGRDRTEGVQARLETSLQALGWAFATVAWSVCVALVLIRCNVPVASLIPAASVLGVGLGFGAQRVVGDVLAGAFLLAERTYVVGDTIRVAEPGSMGGVTGRVEEVTLRVTRLRTADGDLITLPNSELRQVANTTSGWSRLLIDIPVADGTDLDQAAEIINGVGGALAQDPAYRDVVLEAPAVASIEYESGGLQLRVTGKTIPQHQWDVTRELRARIVAALADVGRNP
jgi:small-conductance mechanosensitive channel